MQTMDKHIAGMLSAGWEVMTETSHSGNSRGFRPFAKRDTITVSFRKKHLISEKSVLPVYLPELRRKHEKR
jgi:hypothetical protein